MAAPMLRRAALAALCLVTLVACRTAAPRVEAEDLRIARIEESLLPAVVLEGRAAGRPIAERMERLHVPQVSVAVLDEGRLVWARAHGGAGPETLFQAASLSKPVAAIVALRLVAAGKLGLVEDVNARLRSWKLPGGAATLRQLLGHAAGTSVFGFAGYPAGAPLPSLPQILDGAPPANSEPVRVTGAAGRFSYSGGGYEIVQLLVEDVTGKPFAEVARAELFEPLRMTASTFVQPLPPELEGRAVAGHLADGAEVAGRWHVYPEQAAAGLWTTPSELARLLAELGRARDGHSTMLTAALATAATTAGPGGFGLGFSIEGSGAALRFVHSGANHGYRARFVYYPEHGRGAVVMTSGEAGDVLAAEYLRALAVEYAWPGFPGPTVKKVAASDPATYAAYVGSYRLAPGLAVKVTLDAGRLSITTPDGEAAELHPEGEDRFFLLERDASIRFVRDGDAVTALEARVEGRTVRAARER